MSLIGTSLPLAAYSQAHREIDAAAEIANRRWEITSLRRYKLIGMRSGANLHRGLFINEAVSLAMCGGPNVRGRGGQRERSTINPRVAHPGCARDVFLLGASDSRCGAVGARTRGQALTAVRRQEVELGPERHDARGIDVIVTLIIMPLDVREVDRAGDAGILIELAGKSPKIGIIHESSQIALEMSDIDGIEPHQCGEQPPVRFGQALPAKVSPGCESFLHHVQGRK
jgi:hypothetical protein